MKPSIPILISEKGAILEKAGIDRGKSEIEIILCQLLDCNRLNLYMHGEVLLNDTIIEKLDRIVGRRATRYPLQYILEESWFYGRKFFVSPAVMVPTPETEMLCETAIKFLRQRNIARPRILDLGAGSGVIGITLAAELENCAVVAVDLSPHALKVAARNAREHKVANKIEFLRSDFFSAVNELERFDLILSNPPYISDDEYKTLPPEVLADPKLSLTSGEEGLDAIKIILSDAPNYLSPGGRIMFEIGCNQAGRVMELSAANKRYDTIITLQDLNDIDRVVILSCREE